MRKDVIERKCTLIGTGVFWFCGEMKQTLKPSREWNNCFLLAEVMDDERRELRRQMNSRRSDCGAKNYV